MLEVYHVSIPHSCIMNLRLKYHITVEFTYRVTLPIFQPIELNFMIQKTYIFKIVVVKINSFKVKEYNSKKSICVPSD